MLKKFVISLSLLLILVGCADTKQVSEINIAEVSEKLYEVSDFSGVKLTLQQAQGILFLTDEVIDAKVFVADDNTSDIVAVIQSSDVDTTIASLNDYKDQLVNMANAYSPEELKQINNAYLVSEGQYIVFVICDDYESVINEVNNLLAIN